MPGPLLGGGDAVASGGRHGGGKGGGGPLGGEDMAGRRTEAAGRAEGSGRPEVKSGDAREVEARGGDGRRVEAKGGGVREVEERGSGSRGVEAKRGEDLGGDRGRGRCGRGEPSGACNIAPGSEEGTRTHTRKRQRSEEKTEFSGVSLGYLSSTPSRYHNKLSTASSVSSRKAMSTSSKAKYNKPALKASQSTSSTKRKLELQFEDDGGILQDSTNITYSESPYHRQFHDLFVCPCDMGIPLGSLAHYAANNRKVDLEIPAGDLCGKDFLSPTDDTRAVIAESAGILEQLHEYDRSLEGHYDFTNFAVYRKKKVNFFEINKRVKLSDIEPGSMVRLKNSSSDADYSTFALQAHKHFFSNGIPSELKSWFCLLLEDATSHEDLIVRSISLMEVTRAVFYFIHIYGEFKTLEGNCPRDYNDVVNYLNKRHGGWKARTEQNIFTKEVLTYRDPKSGKVAIYGEDAGELLRLCRNLVTHIFGKPLSRQLCLGYKHILAIINSLFPGLLFDFQVAILKTWNTPRLC